MSAEPAQSFLPSHVDDELAGWLPRNVPKIHPRTSLPNLEGKRASGSAGSCPTATATRTKAPLRQRPRARAAEADHQGGSSLDHDHGGGSELASGRTTSNRQVRSATAHRAEESPREPCATGAEREQDGTRLTNIPAINRRPCHCSCRGGEREGRRLPAAIPAPARRPSLPFASA
jgi:hypothetical protein